MIDINKFSNLNEITREEFDTLVKGEKYEVLTQQNLLKFTSDFKEELEKSEEPLPVSETIELLKAEIGGFNQIKVRENDLSLSVYFIRGIESK